MGRRNQRGSSSAAAAVTASKKREEEKQTEKGRDGRKERLRGREERKEKERDGRTEKQKGREERKEKEKQTGREEGSATATVHHQFFKVFFPEQSAERLKIPSPFQEYLEVQEPNRSVSLRGPSGNTWQVVLTSDSQGLGFTKGWREFAHDHSLVTGHFLVFTYDGRSQFSVAVLCASGVEDKSALHIQPSKEVVVVKVEEEEHAVDVDMAGMLGVGAPSGEEGKRTTRKRVRQVNDVMENRAVAKKRHSSVQKKLEKRKPEATIDASQAAPAGINRIKDSSCLLDDYSSGNRIRFRSKDIPRMGKFVSKKFRLPVIISQRRPVTEEEKNHTFKRAKEFKSKNPFTVQVMMESYVYVGFFLNIPCEFVREWLPQASKKMTLWDPQGKPWEVNYVYYNDRSVAAFSGGWGKFAIGNNLEKFDVCVFELFKEDNIKVHIYRVVPELTPLMRKSSM